MPEPSDTRRALLQAAEERRRRLRDAEQDHFDRTRHSFIYEGHELGYMRPTAETEAKLTEDPIVRLVRTERITREQGRAAVEIREVFERVAGGVFGRSSDLAERCSGARREPSDRLAHLHAHHYLPWARYLGGDPARGPNLEATRGRCQPALELAIDVAVFGGGLRLAERARRWRNGDAVHVLAYALQVYTDIAGWERNLPALAEFEARWDHRRGCLRAIKPPLTGTGIGS